MTGERRKAKKIPKQDQTMPAKQHIQKQGKRLYLKVGGECTKT